VIRTLAWLLHDSAFAGVFIGVDFAIPVRVDDRIAGLPSSSRKKS